MYQCMLAYTQIHMHTHIHTCVYMLKQHPSHVELCEF